MSELICSSAESIEGNDCLLTEILVRVPLRDVITFKRVSRRWRSLISASYFRCCHATVKQRVSGLFFYPFLELYQDVKFFYLDNKTYRSSSSSSFCPKIPNLYCSMITQSCNGLMLLKSKDAMFVYDPTTVFVYNPTTGDKRTLPSFPSVKPFYLHYSLAFDPLHFLGYKVICIIEAMALMNEGFQTMIYSSESGVWKRGSSFPPTIDIDFDRATYFKDSVYWIGRRSNATLRFDLKEECMKDDMPPLPPKPYYREYALAPACGYMNLVGYENISIRVFLLKEEYSSRRWVHMHSNDLRSTLLQAGCHRMSIDGLGVFIGYDHSMIDLIEDHEDDMCLLLEISGKICALRLKDGTYYYLSDFPSCNKIFPSLWGRHRGFQYMESLASV